MNSGKTHEPTREEIVFLTAQIRAEWSESERQKRLRVDWRLQQSKTGQVHRTDQKHD